MLALKVFMFDVYGGKQVFALGCAECRNAEATGINPLNLDNYDVLPTRTVSPFHLWLANRRTVHERSGIVFFCYKTETTCH